MSEEGSTKKVLIITYYWPPSGGSGVQRWLKFVKYLPQFGYVPYVFTPENPAFEIKDESLLKNVPPEAEVLHFPIWEPYSLFKKMTGEESTTVSVNTASEGASFLKRVSIWLRGNLIIPDPRVFWVQPSVKFLHDFLIEQKIRTIITTGPPHSMHLIGLRLKKKNPGLRWIADFRDPWSEWGLLKTLKVGRLAFHMHKYLERKVLASADVVTTITPFYVRQFEGLGNRKVKLLTNGYDENDFEGFTPQRTDKFVIRHVGVILDKVNTVPLMNAVAELCKQNPEFKDRVEVNFVGEVNEEFKQYVREHSTLNDLTTFTKSVPHKEIIRLYEKSSLLLMILAGLKDLEGYMPGKLFEYMATGLPVLGIGPEAGNAAELLTAADFGKMIAPRNSDAITRFLLNTFEDWKNKKTPPRKLLDEYSRKGVTQKLVDLL